VEGLADRILETVAQRPGLKAREIAEHLGVGRRDVNQKLYGTLRARVIQDALFGWHLSGQEPAPVESPASQWPPSQPEIPAAVSPESMSTPARPAILRDAVPKTSERITRVRAAVEAWTRQLIDLSGRNQLLYYRTLKRGTLELTDADPPGVSRLLAGRTVALSELFSPTDEDPDRFDEALSRARTIQRKALMWFEERGIQTLYLAMGMATWSSSTSSASPAAPVLLRPLQIDAQGAARADFKLKLDGDWEVNDTLLHAMATEFSVDADSGHLLRDVVNGGATDGQGRAVFQRLAASCSAVPGFSVVDRLVVGTFSYTKLPMVRDLEEHIEELAESNLIAAIAGDPEARAAIHESREIEVDPTLPDQTAPSDEFLILDADSSQNAAINAVAAGQPLIIQGPPGTGKSQTIANLIASLAARGKRVLFVAEKRAAIEAVVKRLDDVGLRDLVMDLHGGVTSKRQLAADLASALTSVRSALQPDRAETEDRLLRSRSVLNAYVTALHLRREPWGVSVRQILERLGDRRLPLESPRLTGDVLRELAGERLGNLRTDFERWARLSSPFIRGETPWRDAVLESEEAVDTALAAVDSLVARIGPATDLAREVAAAAGLAAGRSLTDWKARLGLLGRVWGLSQEAHPSIWDLDLVAVSENLGPARRSWFGRVAEHLRNPDYRAAKRHVRIIARDRMSARARLNLTESALMALNDWRAAGGSTPEVVPNDVWGPVDAELERLTQMARELGQSIGVEGLASEAAPTIENLVRSLSVDRQTVLRLPLIAELAAQLRAAGIEVLLNAAWDKPELLGDDPADLFDWVWLESLYLDLVRHDRTLAAFDGQSHMSTAAQFRNVDREHVASVPDVIRRRVAEHALPVRNRHPDQDQLVKREANKRSRHLTLRRLFEEAPDVMLALRPCWVMSPLVVSQTMPAAPIFDVVIFDEASQVLPADAVPALLRGRQAVVAGDRRQLPPTTFFRSSVEADDMEDDDLEALTEGFESVLDVLDTLLRSYRLTWHYRSEDERLIAFSNHNIYDASLTTFPGAVAGDCLSFELIPHRPGAHVDRRSNDDEVSRVVDLIVAHARERPHESLGVIAMSIHHADRIEAVLSQRLRSESRDVIEFLDEGANERAFVKNLERVQGDERDAIILTVGYSKMPDGRLPYRFGPLNQQGGERRLNVAVTRARRRLTLVSSFSEVDMDPGRSSAEGVELLRRYLRYAASGGIDLADGEVDVALNPFEVEVKQRLEDAGLSVVPQHGASGYRIDFAIAHPARDGRFVLAVEADGASYHSSYTARDRDRLRQEVLERLGWRVHRIWSTDWYNDSSSEVAKVMDAYRAAIEAAESGGRSATAEPEWFEADVRDSSSPTPQVLTRAHPKPRFHRGRKIGDYTSATLRRVIDWIRSDGRLRTDDELIELAMGELGYQRRGSRIIEALQQAIDESRRRS